MIFTVHAQCEGIMPDTGRCRARGTAQLHVEPTGFGSEYAVRTIDPPLGWVIWDDHVVCKMLCSSCKVRYGAAP